VRCQDLLSGVKCGGAKLIRWQRWYSNMTSCRASKWEHALHDTAWEIEACRCAVPVPRSDGELEYRAHLNNDIADSSDQGDLLCKEEGK